MNRSYVPPKITDYGDVLVDTNGNVEQEGNLSINACPTLDFEVCQMNP